MVVSSRQVSRSLFTSDTIIFFQNIHTKYGATFNAGQIPTYLINWKIIQDRNLLKIFSGSQLMCYSFQIYHYPKAKNHNEIFSIPVSQNGSTFSYYL